MENLGRWMLATGLVLILVGGVLTLGGRWFRFGRLPGDIAIQREGFSLFIPITTMLLLSAALSLALWLVGMLRR